MLNYATGTAKFLIHRLTYTAMGYILYMQIKIPRRGLKGGSK